MLYGMCFRGTIAQIPNDITQFVCRWFILLKAGLCKAATLYH